MHWVCYTPIHPHTAVWIYNARLSPRGWSVTLAVGSPATCFADSAATCSLFLAEPSFPSFVPQEKKRDLCAEREGVETLATTDKLQRSPAVGANEGRGLCSMPHSEVNRTLMSQYRKEQMIEAHNPAQEFLVEFTEFTAHNNIERVPD